MECVGKNEDRIDLLPYFMIIVSNFHRFVCLLFSQNNSESDPLVTIDSSRHTSANESDTLADVSCSGASIKVLLES